MIIEPYGNNAPPGRRPVEIIGETQEIMSVVDIIGFWSPTALRIAAFVLLDHYRGNDHSSVILSPNELLKLTRKAIQVSSADLRDGSDLLSYSPAVAHTGVLEVDDTPSRTKIRVANTILDYCTYYPIPHEQL